MKVLETTALVRRTRTAAGILIATTFFLIPACAPRAQKPVTVLSGPIQPEKTPPTAGERYLEAARAALAGPDYKTAEERLEFVLALGKSIPQRAEALYLLALLKARPDSDNRDRARAIVLLQEAGSVKTVPERKSEALLVLQLLESELEQERIIQQLNIWVSEIESDQIELRTALEQREEELRKIKEILLGKIPQR